MSGRSTRNRVWGASRRRAMRETAMLGKIKAAAKAVTDLAGDALTAGLGQVEASLAELSAASGDLEQLGYRLGQIELACTLPPRLIIYLARHGKAGKEAYQAVLAKHAEHTTVRTVVSMLQTADRLAEQIKWGDRRCSGLAIELGIPP